MNLAVEKKSLISLVSATLLTGISVYFVLSYLLIEIKFVLPICISIALLSLGLTRYYSVSNEKVIDNQYQSKDFVANSEYSSTSDQNNIQKGISNIAFVFIYSVLLIICAFFSIPRLDVVYTSWNLLSLSYIPELIAGILLCFILPGYALLTIVIKNYRMKPLLRILLGYLISMLITGLTVYFSAILFESNIYQDKFILLLVYLAIIIAYVVRYRTYGVILSPDFNVKNLRHSIISVLGNKLWTTLKTNLPESIVFASLSLLVIISTYYLYDGVTIGDQWYHQNRAILFIYGDFKESIIANGDQNYTPLLSSLLAGLTSISGVPLVNAYASIALLNMTTVFAFYYFCRTWLPLNLKRASLFASSLLVISSGLGWMYVLYLAETDPLDSPANAISYFVQEKIRETDIRLSSNFMIAAFPDFNTSLTLVSLPAGFILLSLIKIELPNKVRQLLLVSLVAFLGILFHDEFYIFIIVSSLLVFAYNIRKKIIVYFALLSALALVYVIDSLLPVNYFTSNRIFGISVIEISAIFIIVTLCLYLLRQNWNRYFSRISARTLQPPSKLTKIQLKVAYISKVVFVSMVVYLIALCFLVWIQLPANYIDAHTQNYNTPWYLYPLRMGIVVLFGIAFVLSYLFKKYEREVFVFGIIAIIALFAGPYYNEHRFSKYVMVSLIGFASLMIFKLVGFVGNKKPILNGVLIASIVIAASLSTLMYIGYNALVMQSQDYSHALGRRNFPSANEMLLLDSMRYEIQGGSNNSNVATFPNEYNFRKGDLISKLHAFSGLPLTKSIQTQYILNSSNLDSFYHLLELSNTGYIMIPTNSTNQFTLSDPVRFAITNFQQISNNDDYVVLKVPSLNGPSTNSENEVGILNEMDNSLSSMIESKEELQFNNRTFNYEKDTPEFIQIQKSNQTETVTLNGLKKNGGMTLWSKDLNNEGINYLELHLRTLDETKTGKGISGLKWKDGNRTFFLSLSDKGLQLREQIGKEDKDRILAQNSQVKNNLGVWQLLKVVTFNNSLSIYADNILRIKIPRDLQENVVRVTGVGINSENSVVEFQPIWKGKINVPQEDYNVKDYHYFYALTSLAMSGMGYSSYLENDYSIFSNEAIILPINRQNLSDKLFNNLLNYTKSGGTLVVINAGEKFEGKFYKLFFNEPVVDKTQNFTRIASDNQNRFDLDVSGSTKEFRIKNSSDIKVIASYRNNDNLAVAPFAIVKNVSDKGKIVYINGFGYFDAISANPKNNFLSLVDFSDIFEIDHVHDKSRENKSGSEPIRRFIGDLTIAGKVTLNGSSFFFDNSSLGSSKASVKTISVSDKHGNLKKQFENLSILDIQALGQYKQLTNVTGKITLPSTNSKDNYLGVSLPSEFNMSIELGANSHLTITTNNSNLSNNMIHIGNESKIDLYSISPKSNIAKDILMLLKSPELNVNGNVLFDKTNFRGQEIDDYVPLNLYGKVMVKFDFVDDYKDKFRDGTKIDYLSYIDSLNIDGIRNQTRQQLELPGHISADLERRGMGVPLSSVLGSPVNFAIIIVIILATIVAVLFHKRIYENDSSFIHKQ